MSALMRFHCILLLTFCFSFVVVVDSHFIDQIQFIKILLFWNGNWKSNGSDGLLYFAKRILTTFQFKHLQLKHIGNYLYHNINPKQQQQPLVDLLFLIFLSMKKNPLEVLTNSFIRVVAFLICYFEHGLLEFWWFYKEFFFPHH